MQISDRLTLVQRLSLRLVCFYLIDASTFAGYPQLAGVRLAFPSILLQGEVGPSIFKKTNLIPQFLFLGQICPYTDVMLHNTMR